MKYESNLHDRPLAAEGLVSYRCESPYGGWIMIGAKGDEDAMREALRSNSACTKDGLQIWDGAKYVSVEAAGLAAAGGHS